MFIISVIKIFKPLATDDEMKYYALSEFITVSAYNKML